jgi:hypothetical protein
LVLPEYFLNVSAMRLGYKVYSGAQMASFNLCSGVVCVALVSRFFLGETLSSQKLMGFGLMVVAMALITLKRKQPRRELQASGSAVVPQVVPQPGIGETPTQAQEEQR